MQITIIIILITIFCSLACLHIYWAIGGKWGLNVAIPTNDDNMPVIKPGILATLIVAVGLLALGSVVFLCSTDLNIALPNWLIMVHRYGLLGIAALFLLRAIGDFQYFGVFKKYRHTKFGTYDTKYFVPLCIFISLLAVTLEYIR